MIIFFVLQPWLYSSFPGQSSSNCDLYQTFAVEFNNSFHSFRLLQAFYLQSQVSIRLDYLNTSLHLPYRVYAQIIYFTYNFCNISLPNHNRLYPYSNIPCNQEFLFQYSSLLHSKSSKSKFFLKAQRLRIIFLSLNLYLINQSQSFRYKAKPSIV